MMPRIRLIRIDRELAQLVEQGCDAVEHAHAVQFGDVWETAAEVVERTVAAFGEEVCGEGWGGYLAADLAAGTVVGTCAFKGRPGADGAVEIAYFTFPPFEHRGYATAMAAGLVEVASGTANVTLVVAHTLPQPGPSARILQKNGFQHVGDVRHPEHGTVWRWQRSAAAAVH